MNGSIPTTAQQDLPLAGKRIVITRAQAGSLAQRIAALGGEVVEFPTIEIYPPADPIPLDEAIKKLNRYDWLIFTSANGVQRFLERLAHCHRNTSDLTFVKIAAIGPETAKRLQAAGVANCLVPANYQAEGLLDVLQPQAMRGTRVLIPRAAKAREILPETLRRWGAKVDVVEAYRTVIPKTDTTKLADMLRRREVDMITFTSSSTVSNFVRLFGGQGLEKILGETPIACIGPITKTTVEELNGVAAVVAAEFTIPGLVRTIVEYFQRNVPAH